MGKKIIHFLYCPLLGLGLYGGHRGRRWLENRIKIFKHFVLPCLLAQTSKNFILWVSVRREDKNDDTIREFREFLERVPDFKTVFTYAGVCFIDDKYPEEEAKNRLVGALHGSMGDLINAMGECDEVLMTIQPSDDCYTRNAVMELQAIFAKTPDVQVFGFRNGYVMNYLSGELAEWNPDTIPPFFTIRFPRSVFVEPLEHAQYTGPYRSHEYVGGKMKYSNLDVRGFLVGTHGENISTVFNHPFAGERFAGDERNEILSSFGLSGVSPIVLRVGWRKSFMRKLPVNWQKKLRYWLGERFVAKIYDFLRA